MFMANNANAAIGDIFEGRNGGTREITNIQFEGDLATVVVRTTNRKGRVKERTFTIRRDENGDYQTNSLGTSAFKSFLVEQVKEVKGAEQRDHIRYTAENTSYSELAQMFPHLNVWAFTDGVDLNEEETRELANAGVDLDSFWFSYNAMHLPDEILPAPQLPSIHIIGEASAPFEHVAEYDIPLHLTFAERTPKVVNIYDMIGIEGVREAHAQGWTGKGVKVANRDSSEGTHDDHSEHAIWTIAPEAQIDHLRLNDYGPEYNLEQYSVINHSYGITNTFGLHHGGFSALVEKAVREAPNALHTWAAGNDSTYRGPLGWAPECEFVGEGFHRGFSVDTCTGFKDIVEKGAYELLDNVIIVGHDRNGAMRAGELKDHYITSNRSRISGSTGGTSIAAPKVAGVAALVKQKFPTLGPKEIKRVILDGAIDIGAPGVDEVFGHGMLSVTGALSPRGDLF